MGSHVNYSGLVIAGVGFFLTRFTIALPLYENAVSFYLAGVVPLGLGLGLAAFGVALVVADVDGALVRTTATWCLVGTGTMLVLVVLTLLGSTSGTPTDPEAIRSQTYLSNFLIGGSIGGTFTGVYAARNRRQQSTLRQQANRLEVLNRMLRHEVLNAATAIRGYATLDDERAESSQVLAEKSDAIVSTIEEVKYLARSAGMTERPTATVDLESTLTRSVERVRDAHPAVDVSVDPHPGTLTVRANDRLEHVFTHLLENAAVHTTGDEPAVEVSVAATPTSVRVGVSDDGPGLPESQQALLETGDINEFDDPGKGFGLNVVRLLVEEYGGRIETDVHETGTTITVVLRRADADGTTLPVSQSNLIGVRPAVPHLIVTLGAAIVAGVFYGLAAEQLGGSVGFIGVYYGVQNPVVGWIAHEFHSVVFAFVFASLVSLAPGRYRDWLPTYVAIGIAWGVFLWVVAAGIVSPVWLQLLGIPAPIPSISPMLLVTHLVWGSSLGVLTALGYRYVTPWLAAVGGDARRRRR